jgi:hypothetical protein
MKEVQLQVERTEQQRKAWQALADPKVRRLMYGGAKGGGKSWFLCVWMFTVVWAIMVQAKLKPSKNPPHVAWFGRKQATDLTGTTLQTWREVIPEEYYKLRGGTERDPKHILIADRIAIDYGGLDKQENINKFNSAEYIIVAIDQAEEVSKDDISVLRGSLRMVLKDPNSKPLKIPFKELYTANPRQCWLKDDFINNPKDNARFVPALPSDNPYLPDSYVQTLTEAFEHRPELLEAYLHGSWDALEGADQIIKSRWLTESVGKVLAGYGKRPRLAVDTARFGDDETVIYYFDLFDVKEQWIMPQCRSTEISNKLAALSRQRGNCPCVVEATGGDIGAAVIDELTELGVETVLYNPQGKAKEEEKYYNMRAEVWSTAAKMLSRGESEFNLDCMSENDIITLRSQLCSPTYKFRNGKTLVESKADIKARLGRSPDRADCWVIGQWSYNEVSAIPKDVPLDVFMPTSSASRKRAWNAPKRKRRV